MAPASLEISPQKFRGGQGRLASVADSNVQVARDDVSQQMSLAKFPSTCAERSTAAEQSEKTLL